MKRLALILFLGFALPQPALSHGTHGGDFGGLTADSAGYHLELAIRDGMVRAWVRDHDGKPVAASGVVSLLAGKGKLDLPLVPEGISLSAAAPVRAADAVTAILRLDVAGQTVSARFSQDAVRQPTLKDQAQAGGVLFQAACATCHGSSLRGSEQGPPLLHPYYAPGQGHGDAVIVAAIRGGAKAHHWKFGDMPRPEGVPPGQEANIVAFIRAMQMANGLDGGGHGGHH